MRSFFLLTLALAATFASSELAAEVPRELSNNDDYGYDDDYSYGGMMSGKGSGKGSGSSGMMSGKGSGSSGMMSGKGSGKGHSNPRPAPFPEPTNPPLEPCVCVEICEEADDDSYGKAGKAGMMRELKMGKGKSYNDDYTPEPICYEECSGDCYPEPPALECCEFETVCEEEEREEGKGKAGLMSGKAGMMRDLKMGKGMGSYSDDDSSPVCEDVCVKYCPPDEPIYTFTPGDGDMCYDTASYTTGDDCVCNCECCMDGVESPEEDDYGYGYGKGKGGKMSGGKAGMMSGKGKRELKMGKGSGKGHGHYEEPDASFSCACGCSCPDTVPAPEPSPAPRPSGKGMMGGKAGMMSGKGSGKAGMMSN
jgi:hypothetical protein